MALNKKSLRNRVLVGIAVFVVIIGMILLNVYFPNYIDDKDSFISGRAITSVIFYAIILLSVIEMRRALGRERIPDSFSWLLWMYGFGAGPAYSLFGYMGIIFFSLLVFISAVVTALFINRVDSLMYIGFMLIYPGLLMASLLYLNRSAATNIDIDNTALQRVLERDIWGFWGNGRLSNYLLPLNAISLAFVFAVSTFTDIFAYFVGSLFGKHKLCPDISPNKTVEGAIGGVVGGMLGSAVVYFFFDFPYFCPFGEEFGLTFVGLGLPPYQIILSYVVIGILGSVATQIGDLLASMVKRYCGVKDYSRILGEHGGIMDRFDGIMLNSVLVSFVFMFIF